MTSTARVITLTFSPTLDVATSADVVSPMSKIRCEAPRQEPGGGGINVARAARRLGAATTAVTPLAGDSGRTIVEQLRNEGIRVEQIVTKEPIRQSFAVTENSTGRQFRFVLPPVRLDPVDAGRCVDAICRLGRDAGCVVVSGSIDVPKVGEILQTIVETVGPTPVLVDTSLDALDAALASGAALLKPSARELAELVGRSLDAEDDIAAAATEIVDHANVGAILVSIGPGGAVLARPDAPIVRFRAPTVRVRSTIGAGDSLVAGIATGLSRGDSLVDSIRLGIAAGTATVMTDATELCDPTEVARLLPMVFVEEVAC